MKKKNQLADDCDQILKFFDEDCMLDDAIAEVTQREREEIFKALEEKTPYDEDDLVAHESDIRAVAFAMGYLVGTGRIVTGLNEASKRATKALIEAVDSRRRIE